MSDLKDSKAKKYKISFCTVCMNRLHHLRETLPKNITDNLSYGNIEFVVLNYNSKDELDEWIKTEMSEHLENGILKYYKTTEPDSFFMSHSKNVVARCAEGEIICNVDADNFIGSGFADFVNTEFNKNENIYLSVDKTKTTQDCFGRICIKTTDFNTIKGYDENMLGYGFEDFDLRNRLEMLSLKRVFIEDSKHLEAINHTDDERLKDEKNLLTINAIYVHYINHSSSKLLYLFKNLNYFIGKIGDNRLVNSLSKENIFPENHKHEYQYSLFGDQWEKGKWQMEHQKIMLGNTKTFVKEENTLYANGEKYKKVHEKEEISGLIMFYSQINNRMRMMNNKKNKSLVVNKISFGKANLAKNYDTTILIK